MKVFAVIALLAAADPVTVVGDQPITRHDLDHRVALMRALYGQSDTRQALEQLKAEARALDVARRRDVIVSRAEIDRFVDSILRANGITEAGLTSALAHYGAAMDDLRGWIAARLAWVKATKRPDDPNYAFPGLLARQPRPPHRP